MIGALIMVHGDDNGLVLPPKIAPTQVVIVPIGNDENILKLAEDFSKKLQNAGISNYIDNSEKSVEFKFAEHEVNVIPFRIEIGARDLEQQLFTMSRRDTRERFIYKINCNIVSAVSHLLDDIQVSLYNKALRRRDESTFTAKNLDEVKKIMPV